MLVVGLCEARNFVNVHGSVESIAANNHVKMGGWEGAGLGCWIKALSSQGRAWETKAGLGRGDEGGQQPEGRDGIRLHLGDWSCLEGSRLEVS